MTATAVPGFAKMGMTFSKQEFSCFIKVRHEKIECKNWIVSTPEFSMIHSNVRINNWIKLMQ